MAKPHKPRVSHVKQKHRIRRLPRGNCGKDVKFDSEGEGGLVGYVYVCLSMCLCVYVHVFPEAK